MFSSGVLDDTEMIYYSNSEWCGDRVDKKNTTWYLCNYLGDAISWCSKKQPMVALPTCEVEYIVGALSACQAVWLMNLL